MDILDGQVTYDQCGECGHWYPVTRDNWGICPQHDYAGVGCQSVDGI